MPTAKPWPGDPEAVWAAAAHPLPREALRPMSAPPDVAGFDDFAARVAPRPGIASAIISLIAGIFFSAEGIALLALRPDWRPDDAEGFEAVFFFALHWHWLPAIAAGLWFLFSAPRIYRREYREHPGEVRALYEAFHDRGVLCELFSTPYKVQSGDGWAAAALAVDVRLPPERAARVRRAFKAWFAVLADDKRADKEAADLHRGRDVLEATELFGPEAEGGYLVHSGFMETWTVLIPDPPGGKKRWERLGVRKAAPAA
ncbi:hypothetical protein LO763_01855 [Glycomyces sp. A-F 0318]|uniref:hypothetical protein n=1 Tax=Glycomyces amatae TaxID=2881355 RepID=UPI001E3AD3C8|nr:hypothetical protein [Glycomyces amatae]MCD0442371.1 hypothetical protein [Glycomyces amatae]